MFQIARELRLRDIGGIIVVDFIDMADECKSKSLFLLRVRMCMLHICTYFSTAMGLFVYLLAYYVSA